MNEKIERMNGIMADINDIYVMLCQGDVSEAFQKLASVVANVNGVLAELINNIPKLCQYDINIPSDVILQQLNNMLEAYENRDTILLSDTLHYEITDTLQFYKEILQECIKENIEL